jgi:hypothetical protein
MRAFEKKRTDENRMLITRMKNTTSNLSKGKLLRHSEKSFKHRDHLSRYGQNIRHFNELPKIFSYQGFANSGSDPSLTSRAQAKTERTHVTRGTTAVGRESDWSPPRGNLNKVRGSHLEFLDSFENNDLGKERETNFYEKGSLLVQVKFFV